MQTTRRDIWRHIGFYAGVILLLLMSGFFLWAGQAALRLNNAPSEYLIVGTIALLLGVVLLSTVIGLLFKQGWALKAAIGIVVIILFSFVFVVHGYVLMGLMPSMRITQDDMMSFIRGALLVPLWALSLWALTHPATKAKFFPQTEGSPLETGIHLDFPKTAPLYHFFVAIMAWNYILFGAIFMALIGRDESVGMLAKLFLVLMFMVTLIIGLNMLSRGVLGRMGNVILSFVFALLAAAQFLWALVSASLWASLMFLLCFLFFAAYLYMLWRSVEPTHTSV